MIPTLPFTPTEAPALAVVTIVVAESEAGQRLDMFLTTQLTAQGGPEAFSRVRVQQLIKEGFVEQQLPPPPEGATKDRGLPAVAENATEQTSRNPAKKVRLGEVYVVDVPAVVASTMVAENIPLEILYEDDDLLVLNKEAGLTVHPAVGHVTGTLVHALLWHCQGVEGLSGINGEARPGIVHRLDKDTSGVMVVAKHDKAHRGLAKQFAAHSIHRAYLALVHGMPLPAAGKIETMLARDPNNRQRQAVFAINKRPEGPLEPWVTEQKYARQQLATQRVQARVTGVGGSKNPARGDDPSFLDDDEPEEIGKLAITHYQVEKVFGQGTKTPASLVRCRLETGRTHQIRVHMTHKGWPLLNDPMYGKRLPALMTSLPGQALHAAELGFTHPMTGDWMDFSAELPPAFQALLDKLQQPTSKT